MGKLWLAGLLTLSLSGCTTEYPFLRGDRATPNTEPDPIPIAVDAVQTETDPGDGIFEKKETPRCMQNVEIEAEGSVNLMIMADISNNSAGFDSAEERVKILSQSILDLGGLLDDGAVDLGITTFPDWSVDTSTCKAASAPLFDCAARNYEHMVGQIRELEPHPGVPLIETLRKFRMADFSPEFQNASWSDHRLLVVIASGPDTCMGQDSDETANLRSLAQEATFLKSKGIETAAIFFSREAVNSAVEENSAAPRQYLASDGTGLISALLSSVGQLAECHVSLDDTNIAPGSNSIAVQLDGHPVKFKENCWDQTGWAWTDITRKSIRFCDATCGLLTFGKVQNIQLDWDCPVKKLLPS